MCRPLTVSGRVSVLLSVTVYVSFWPLALCRPTTVSANGLVANGAGMRLIVSLTVSQAVVRVTHSV